MSADQKKQCIICGDAMTGRPDKRFCSDNCRSTYHNRQNSNTNNFIRNINNILRKNRRILAALNPNGKANVHRDKLVEQGFNFRYFTNEYVTRKEVVYRFIYDQGYTERENDYYTLVVRQEYVQ